MLPGVGPGLERFPPIFRSFEIGSGFDSQDGLGIFLTNRDTCFRNLCLFRTDGVRTTH